MKDYDISRPIEWSKNKTYTNTLTHWNSGVGERKKFFRSFTQHKYPDYGGKSVFWH